MGTAEAEETSKRSWFTEDLLLPEEQVHADGDREWQPAAVDSDNASEDFFFEKLKMA